MFFTQLWWRPLLGVRMDLGEWICHVLSEEMSFQAFFLPHGPIITKTKKNRKQSQMKHFEKHGLEIG